MALTWLAGNIIEGLSTDTKPSNVIVGSKFREIDQNFREYIYIGNAWFLRQTTDQDSFYDDFESGTFDFTEGGTSPNGLWKNKFLGSAGGTSGVRNVVGVGNVQYLKTASVVGTTSIVNYILPLVFQDFELTCRMRTISQTANRAKNDWETAWIIWRVGDILAQQGYYFTIKMAGSEYGKSDNKEGSVANYVLVTPGSPSCTLGQWYNIRIRVVGNWHKVWVDNNLVIDYEDINPNYAPSPSRQIQRAGYVTTYCEDAEVEFDSFRVIPIYPKALLDYDQSVHNMVPAVSSNRKYGSYNGATSATGDGLLAGILQRVGTGGAISRDDLGIHYTFPTTTTQYDQSGLSTNVAFTRRTHNPIFRIKFKIPSVITNCQMWFGFASSATLPANSTDPLNAANGFLVGFVSGGNFLIRSNDGTGASASTAEGLVPAIDKWHNIAMELQSANQCIARVDNRTPIIITTAASKPLLSTDLYMHAVVQTTNTTAKTMLIDHIDVEISPGVDV